MGIILNYILNPKILIQKNMPSLIALTFKNRTPIGVKRKAILIRFDLTNGMHCLAFQQQGR